MSPIVPRWEWRTFGRRFGPAEQAFAALTPETVHDSDEIYVLAAGGDTVKVRDDLMDIKVLREVDPDGLERWEPVLKAGFPLSAADAARVFEGLHATPPPLTREAYTLDQFIAELVEATEGVRAVPVHKHRVRYTVGGCMAECSDVTAGGRSTRTIAIEAEDAGAVVVAVRSIGLDGYRNTAYPKGLAALLDDLADRYAVIDVGTNSVKFHVAERTPDGGWSRVVDRAEVTRLGEGIETDGAIAVDAADRTSAAIRAMVEQADALGVKAIAAVGTAGLRMATNREAVLAAIHDASGVWVEVISGEEETRLAYLAAGAGLGPHTGTVVVFDTGGGSTQFTFGHDGVVDERFSLDVGAVRYTERFGLAGVTSEATLSEAVATIAADLAVLDDRPRPSALVGMGGAITNITAVRHGLTTYDPDVVQGTLLERAEIDRQIERYRALDADGRRGIVGLQPKRAEVILAGACIVRTVMDKIGVSSLTVSDRGLRQGVLAERFGD